MLDIVVPTLNEEANIDALVVRLKKACPDARLIFVDNGSTDRTLEILEGHKVDIIRHEVDEGYGKSLLDGILAGSAEHIVTIDADLEYPPESIPDMVARLKDHAVVYGSRFADAGDPGMGAFRNYGNRLVSIAFNILYGQSLTDLYTGIKAFRRSAVDGLNFDCSGFVFVVEFAAKLVRRGARIDELAVEYTLRRAGRRKMKHLVEAAKAFSLLAYYRVFPFRLNS